jgi:hypothetical protein
VSVAMLIPTITRSLKATGKLTSENNLLFEFEEPLYEEFFSQTYYISLEAVHFTLINHCDEDVVLDISSSLCRNQPTTKIFEDWQILGTIFLKLSDLFLNTTRVSSTILRSSERVFLINNPSRKFTFLIRDLLSNKRVLQQLKNTEVTFNVNFYKSKQL